MTGRKTEDELSRGDRGGQESRLPPRDLEDGAADATGNCSPGSRAESADVSTPPTADNAADSEKVETPLYSAPDWTRIYDEGVSADQWRPEPYRDYARVIHSPSWRRLQGKTQLFPGHESDFFRNRLTHSLEVAQVAEAIALRLNYEHPYFRQHPLDPRVCSTAGLMHDLGHPPFGHNGEHALDDRMREFGGFEGNAQTIRIISCLEKKVERTAIGGRETRVGLNLTHRVVASALKYDRQIPNVRDSSERLVKGYYAADAGVVEQIKSAVAPGWKERGKPFKTIECSIMDLADDIAYSAYDLEDSLKAGFLTPGSILSSSDQLLDRVAAKVGDAVGESISREDVLSVLVEIFSDVVAPSEEGSLFSIVRAFQASRELSESGYLRTALTSQLVGEAVRSIEVDVDERFPMLSSAKMSRSALIKVETLKNYNFEATIFSSRLKVSEFRGYGIVTGIFDALSHEKGYLMMPDDVRELHRLAEADATARRRVICDFIAGMTDRYAVEFYARLNSDGGQTIF